MELRGKVIMVMLLAKQHFLQRPLVSDMSTLGKNKNI